MNPAWAPSMFTRWKARPRCQSDVCRSRMIPDPNGRVRHHGGLLPYQPVMTRPAPVRYVRLAMNFRYGGGERHASP
ncbi:hypothetical protein TNCT1_13250 [Streptomyces sp. 1-11]|nr:hypothetical protein TNCT1_13250 [Streptomyces sp. 1-11]